MWYLNSMKETLERFRIFLVNERGMRPRTIDAYLSYLVRMYVHVEGDILKTCVKYRDVANLIMDLKQKHSWSDRQAYKVASMASVFFNWACREDLIQESPMRLGHSFKKAETKQADFFDWESEDFIKIMSYPNNTIRFRTMICILKSSGIRASECAALRIEDVKDRYLIIREGKGGRTRYAVIDDDARKWLDIYISDLRKHYVGEWLFPLENFKGHVSAHGIWRMLSNLGKKLGVHLYPHKLRHSLAGQLIGNGADVTIAAEVLGHKSLSATKIYSHFKKEKTLQLYDKFTNVA